MNSSLCEVQIIFINVVNYCEELSRWLVAAHSTMANMSAECSVTSSSCSHAHAAANINLDHTNTSCSAAYQGSREQCYKLGSGKLMANQNGLFHMAMSGILNSSKTGDTAKT